MLLCALGINHKTAPVSIRERVVFGPDRQRDALRELRGLDGVAEAAIISTCNRTELYYGGEQDDVKRVIEWLGRFHSLDADSLEPYVYFHRDDEAVRHLLRVASGLDSMILGEPQILGQVKQAYQQATDAETVGQVLGRLFQHTFSVAKQVRTETAIGSSPVSMAFAAVSLAKQILGNLEDQSALLIGAGETIELAARHLKESGLGNVIVANRSVDRARLLASEFNGYAIGLDEIPAHLHEADIVIASTAAPTTVLNLPEVKAAIRKRKHRPVFMVDLAVPRDIAADVGKLEDVYLYTVDDLQEVVQEGLRSRQEAAAQAEDIIGNQVSHFMGWLRIMRGAETIRAFRNQAEATRDDVLARARRQLAAGHAADEVLEQLANTLTNKLIHDPCVSLRQAFEQDHVEIIDTARVLLNIRETDK